MSYDGHTEDMVVRTLSFFVSVRTFTLEKSAKNQGGGASMIYDEYESMHPVTRRIAVDNEQKISGCLTHHAPTCILEFLC